MSTIDLNNPPPNHTLSVAVDREETKGEQAVRLTKDLSLFFVAIGFIVAIVSLCYSTVIDVTASAEEKKWAMSVLSASAAGLIGYLIRK